MDCISTAVLDSAEARPLYLEAVDFMEHSLGLSIPPGMREVPVLAVDMPSLNEQMSRGISASHAGTAVTRGLTLSTVGEVRHMSPGMLRWNPLDGSILGYEAPTVYRTEEVREVTAVLVLYGLPRDLTAAILTHEAMHVWLRLSHHMPRELPSKVEEGLCQFISSKYLESVQDSAASAKDASSSSSSSSTMSSNTRASFTAPNRKPLTRTSSGGIPIGSVSHNSSDDAAVERRLKENNDKLRALFRCQIEADTSPVYGEGYREAACCCAALGLDIVLSHVRENRVLPNV
jgi:hypothetical protein